MKQPEEAESRCQQIAVFLVAHNYMTILTSPHEKKINIKTKFNFQVINRNRETNFKLSVLL